MCFFLYFDDTDGYLGYNDDGIYGDFVEEARHV